MQMRSAPMDRSVSLLFEQRWLCLLKVELSFRFRAKAIPLIRSENLDQTARAHHVKA
jgi:hypothetical protein